ncbi:MAG TPA: adenylate cyclase [Acidimicrobiia bacterium]
MTTRRVLDDEQLAELLRLTKVADTVELKLTIPDTDMRSVGDLLGMDPLDAQIRQIIFFDTPELSLQAAGVVVRARRIQGGAGDTVVKLRPVTPEIVGTLSGASVEVDAMPGGFVCSASVKGKSTADDVRKVVRRKAKLGEILSKAQKEFYRGHAPEGLRLSDLSVLGPINIFKLKFEPRGLERAMVAELWFYPNGTRVLELSTKCPPADIFRVAAETRTYLTDRGVDVTGEQQTKTKTALTHFAKALVAAQAEPAGV